MSDFWGTPNYPSDRDEWYANRNDGYDDRPTAADLEDDYPLSMSQQDLSHDPWDDVPTHVEHRTITKEAPTSIQCGHCGRRHATVNQVWWCSLG